MKKVNDFIKLKKEANLFDAKLYILKAFVAVLTAYSIGSRLPLVQKDMISVLFGLMMTLEPVTVTGIRSGLKQMAATILGALASAIIIFFFGINMWTVALSISATLFICLKIDWKEVSPVAIFTSIYMTQFVQYTADGEPSIALTFRLRIVALGFGILVAIIFNFLFATFFYRRMERKRIAHVLNNLADHMSKIKIGLQENSIEQINKEKELLPGTFIGIDWLTSLIRDKEKEAALKKKLHMVNSYDETMIYQEILVDLRNITHLLYDTTYVLSFRLQELSEKERKEIAARMGSLSTECEYMSSHCEGNFIKYTAQGHSSSKLNISDSRFSYNLESMQNMLNLINNTLYLLTAKTSK